MHEPECTYININTMIKLFLCIVQFELCFLFLSDYFVFFNSSKMSMCLKMVLLVMLGYFAFFGFS